MNLIAPIQLAKNNHNSKHCGDRYTSQLILCDICGNNKNRFFGSLLLFLEIWSNSFTKLIFRISIIIQKISFLLNYDCILERVLIVRNDPSWIFQCTRMKQTYRYFIRNLTGFEILPGFDPIIRFFISHFFNVSLILSDDKQ